MEWLDKSLESNDTVNFSNPQNTFKTALQMFPLRKNPQI